MAKRIDVELWGLKIGTASGWDQAGDFDLQFYDFEPSPLGTAMGLPSNTILGIFPWKGVIEHYPGDGSEAVRVDAANALVTLAQAIVPSKKDDKT